MFTLSLNDITEAIGNVVDGIETVFMSLNSLDNGVDVVLNIPNPLTEAVGTTINLVEPGFNEIQLLLHVRDLLFEDCKTPFMSMRILVDIV